MEFTIPAEIHDIVMYLKNKEGLTFYQTLGQGRFSWVYEARVGNGSDQRSVAIKVCSRCFPGDFEWWPQLDHPNLLKLLRKIELDDSGIWTWKVAYLMPVMRKCLKRRIYSTSAHPPPSVEELRKWILGLIEAVKYLHGLKFYHLDITVANVMISQHNEMILGDFSTLLQTDGCIPYRVVGLPLMFQPPDVLAFSGKTFREIDPAAVDIWGIGLIAVQLVFGQSIWKPVIYCTKKGGSSAQIAQLVSETLAKLTDRTIFSEMLGASASASLFNSDDTTAFWSFVKMCLHLDPVERKRLFHIAENHVFLVHAKTNV